MLIFKEIVTTFDIMLAILMFASKQHCDDKDARSVANLIIIFMFGNIFSTWI